MDFDVLVGGAVVLPLADPLLQNLPHVSACDWHFLYAEYSKRRSMEHLLNSARSGLEHGKRYHLIQLYVFLLMNSRLNGVSVEGREGRGLREQLLLRGALQELAQVVKLR